MKENADGAVKLSPSLLIIIYILAEIPAWGGL